MNYAKSGAIQLEFAIHKLYNSQSKTIDLRGKVRGYPIDNVLQRLLDINQIKTKLRYLISAIMN